MTVKNKFSSIMSITKRPNIIFSHGKGSWITDIQGNQYLDFIQGWAVNTLGHSPKVISETLSQQASTLISTSPAFYNQPMIDCANTLTDNSIFDQVFFANSGAEANEGAIKLARKWGEKYKDGAYKIITFENSFHGRTLTTMAASGKGAFKDLFEPKTPGFIKVPFNNANAVEASIDKQTVAIMLEPIQGEAGVIPATDSFMIALRELADKYQLLLIFDEVQTGVARTDNLFAYESYSNSTQSQIHPDIMTLGKGLGGGVPISALLAKPEVCVFEYGDQGGTYNGNPLMTAVANVILNEVIKPEFLKQVKKSENHLKQQLQKLSQKHSLGDVRGRGLLLGLDTKHQNANKIVEGCQINNLLINAPQENILRFMPALNVSKNEIEQMIHILDGVLTSPITHSDKSFDI